MPRALTSRTVSEAVASVTPDFQKELIASRVALRDGRETDEVITQWDINGAASISLGNAVDLAVRLWEDHGVTHKHPVLKEVVNSWKDFTKPFSPITTAVYFSNDNLRGEADAIESHGEKEISIGDIKTWSNHKKANGKMLPPFDHIPNSPVGKATIQLSCYKYLAESENYGYTVRDLWVALYNGGWKRIKIKPLDITPLVTG